MSEIKFRRMTQFEIQRIFTTGLLTQRQRDKVIQIVKILSEYMIVDRDILNYRSKQLFGEKIGLSYIQRAVKLELIAEYRTNDNYFYEIAVGGLNLMLLSKRDFRKFNILDEFYHKKRVLLLNQFLMKEGLNLVDSDFSDMDNYLYFHCQDKEENNIIAFFEDEVDARKLFFEGELLFEFKAIPLEDTSFTDSLINDPDIYDKEREKIIRAGKAHKETHSRMYNTGWGYREGSPEYSLDWKVPDNLMSKEEKKWFDIYKQEKQSEER